MRKRLIAANGRQVMDRLPLELLELFLLRTFVKLFTDHYKSQFNVRRVSVQRSYSALAAVCYNWWQTMNGWPQSPTGHWFRHQLHLCIKYVCQPFNVVPKPRCSVSIPTTAKVLGVTQCHALLYMVCENSEEVVVVDLNAPNKRLPSIRLVGLQEPNDIVACTETRQLYVADVTDYGCIWRASTDGRRVEKWKRSESVEMMKILLLYGMQKICWSLSIRSGQLLAIMSYSVLVLYDGSDGSVVRTVPVGRCRHSSRNEEILHMVQHAVETARATFVVVMVGIEPTAPAIIAEVDSAGREIRSFSDPKLLEEPLYIALDSHGRIFVADNALDRVLLLTDRLKLERIIVDVACLSDESRVKIQDPSCISYEQEAGRLVVAALHSVCVYNIRSEGDESRITAKNRKCSVM